MYLKLIIPTFFILLSIVVLSCEYKSTIGNPEENLAVEAGNNDSSLEINDELEEDENDPHEPEITFPKTGNKASDFLPKLGIYKIQYQAKGDLNKDGKVDIVLVLVHKDVKTEERPMLILLQNKDKSYRLDKISQIAFPIEYNDYDSKLFDTEDIAIDKGELNINLYSIGPSGNAFGKFKYIGNDFVLTYIEVYYRGAGGSSGLVYDLSKGEITTTETNTIEEDMPTASETLKRKAERHLFESTSLTNFFNKDE